MANGVFSSRIDASTKSEKVEGNHRITGIQLFVPFDYPSGTSTAGTHYEMSLEDANLLLSEIQKGIDLASQVNNGPTPDSVPPMLIDGRGDPERRKQMQDAINEINQKRGNKK